MCFVVLRQTQSPKNDIDAQTQDTNAGEKQIAKFLNSLGGSVADWRPYGGTQKTKKAGARPAFS
jgi:hypothetical protein